MLRDRKIRHRNCETQHLASSADSDEPHSQSGQSHESTFELIAGPVSCCEPTLNRASLNPVCSAQNIAGWNPLINWLRKIARLKGAD